MAAEIKELMGKRTQRDIPTSVIEFCKGEADFVNTIEDMLDQIDFLDKSLNEYLD